MMDKNKKTKIFGEDYYYGQKFSNYRNYDDYDSDHHWKPVIKTLKGLGVTGRILDIGCAFGYFLKRAAPLFQEVYGVDISSFAIEKAKTALPSATFQVLDMDTTELPYPDEYFEVITAFDVLEHTQSIPKSLERIIPKLKMGGYLIFSVPLQDTWAGKRFHSCDKDVSHVSVPTKHQLADFIEQSGLRIIKESSFWIIRHLRIPVIPVDCEVILQKRWSTSDPENLFIKPGYSPPTQAKSFDNSRVNTQRIVLQPHAYLFARYLARRFGCHYIIDVRYGRIRKLGVLPFEFKLFGSDFGSSTAPWRRSPFGRRIEWNLDAPNAVFLDRKIIKNAVIVCSGVIEYLADPTPLLRNLKAWLDDAPVAILTTPAMDLLRGVDDDGPPANPDHLREWNARELELLLKEHGLNVAFTGLTTNNSLDRQKSTILTVLENNRSPQICPAPPDFRVVAIMCAYNEEDIIVPSIDYLTRQGIEVYLIDNWSTDRTAELAKQFLGRGLMTLERFPPDRPPKYFSLRQLLKHVEEVSQRIDAHWVIHHDVDEFREAPWPGVSLKDAIYCVDQCGFNCIDHTVIEFRPVDNSFSPGADFVEHFKFYTLSKLRPHFVQLKAWRSGLPVSLARSGGHQARFDQRRIYPYKFLLRHYPIRSQAHGMKKIFIERKSRWNPLERARGWHRHYDAIEENHMFLRNPSDLELFDEEAFRKMYLVERLSGIGIARQRVVSMLWEIRWSRLRKFLRNMLGRSNVK